MIESTGIHGTKPRPMKFVFSKYVSVERKQVKEFCAAFQNGVLINEATKLKCTVNVIDFFLVFLCSYRRSRGILL